MPNPLPSASPELAEYSVVYTDRAINHMSATFQQVLRDISGILKRAYRAQAAIVVPGSGTFGMEAVARQFATARRCLIIRNGWFSYRWTQILDMGGIASQATVLKARRTADRRNAPFAPPPIEEVVAAIRETRPEVVFAPHVETASGMILPDDYVRTLGEEVRRHGGLFVLDCIASGTLWVDMAASSVDILLSAPQKGWSGSPCCAFVMLGERARARIDSTTSTSFACDLRKWLQIMQAYENGGHAYHATMPTDALARCRDAMKETERCGFGRLRDAQQELGDRVRAALTSAGYKSVAAEGFQAPGVVVSYTDDPDMQSGKKFVAEGIQIAAGVPLECDEGPDFRTFRIGLFGLDKLNNVEGTVRRLEDALRRISG